MQLPEEIIREYQAAYREVYNEEIEFPYAAKEATDMVNLFFFTYDAPVFFTATSENDNAY